MLKLTLKESLVLQEARDPEKRKYKEIYAKSEVERVVATLADSEAAVFTRIARSYYRLGEMIKRASMKYDEKNKQLRGMVTDIFDADDIFVTRVAETSKFAIMLYKKKRPDPDAKEPTVTNWEKVAEDLLKLIDKDLLPQATAIIDAHTKLKKVNAEKDPSLKVEPVMEGVLDTLKKWGEKFLKAMLSWAVSFDKKLEALKKRAA